MNFLEKIENLVNLLLIKLGELAYKAIPKPLKNIIENFQAKKEVFVLFLKKLPALIKVFILNLVGKTKSTALTFDYKAALVETYSKAMAQYKERSPAGMGKLKTLFMTPILMLGQWLKGLSATQSLLLLSFSCASLLAIIGIGFSGRKLAGNHLDISRGPASDLEELVAYERPEYYKKQTRFFDMTNLRLPVYFAKVNEIISIDIDFSATMKNRTSKMFLEKHEFHLRDHLILQIEPSIASFPLEEEGKEIIRRKLLLEINDFLKLHGVEGEVLELKITYVLAN
jgi:flagellar basal body-associated protein FliL